MQQHIVAEAIKYKMFLLLSLIIIVLAVILVTSWGHTFKLLV